MVITMTRTSKQHYKYLDDLETKELKKVNELIELNKNEYKNKILANVKKTQFANANFYLDGSKYLTIAENLFKSIDELNIIMYKDIAKYYYDLAIEDIRKIVDKEVENKYNDDTFDNIINKFIASKGINYIYSQELERRLEYYNSQMINASMATVNRKVQSLEQKYLNQNYEKVVKDSLDMNSEDVKATLKTQKKEIGNFIDNVGVFVAGMGAMQAFKDNEIEKVVWIAEEDDRTCTICLDYNGTIYDIDSVPTIPVHLSCRCHLEPYIEEKG